MSSGTLSNSRGTGAPPSQLPSPVGSAVPETILDNSNHHVSNCLSPSSNTSYSSSCQSGLNISHVNIYSITSPNRLDELEQFANSNHIHILCATETKLDSTVHPSLYTMSSFSSPFTRHRTRHGGGVAIYVRDNLASSRITELEFEDTECLWIKIRVQNETIIICCVYFPPNQNSTQLKCFLDNLSDSVMQAQTHLPSSITIVGDFNVGNIYLKPEFNNQHSGITHHDILFQDTMFGLNLTQLIHEPTRITTTTANLRDLIIVSDEQNVSAYGLLSPFSQIDHIPTYIRLNYTTINKAPFTKEVWDYHRINIDAFIHILAHKNWDDILNNEIDEATQLLTEFILDAASYCIPKIQIHVKRNDKPWVTRALKREIGKRNRLFKSAKRSNVERDWNIWKEQRRFVTDMNRRLKTKHIQNQVHRLIENKLNPKKYHDILKTIVGRERKSCIPPALVDTNGQIYEDDADKANILNNYFASQSQDMFPDKQVPYCVPDREVPVINDIIITEEEVFKQLKLLNINKSSGSDGIPNKILKMIAIFVKEPLTKLFNKSLNNGKYPSVWKHAKITPIFKNKGTPSDIKSYRPISLLPSMSKIFEKIIFNRIYEHLTFNNLLTDKQSGYRPNHGTHTQLIYLIHCLHASLDKNMDFSIVYLDISRYFDKIWHQGLLAKCEHQCGLKGNILRWLESYLSSRTHSVSINNSISATQTINAGCPQGSVLGPLLALIYLNDLDGITENELFFFADDTILFKSHSHDSPGAEMSVQRDLDKIKLFGDKWAITFNSAKTTQQTFTNKHVSHPPLLKFENEVIPNVVNHKHLGLNISNDLRFHFHVQEIIKKANTAMGPLYPIAKHIPRHILQHIYTTYIRPIFDYGDAVYHGHLTVADSLSLERIQNRAARLITGAFRRTPTKALLEELGLTTLQFRRELHSLNILYTIKRHAPQYLQDAIPYARHEVTTHQLRNANNITLPSHRLTSFKNSFILRTISHWNRLPEEVRTMSSTRSFKQAVARMYDLTKPPAYFSYGSKINNILHTRLRLGMSSLNVHLFQIHSSQTNTPNCSCKQTAETVKHFFFFCSHYTLPRVELEFTLHNLIANYSQLNTNHKLAIILHGYNLTNAAGLAVAVAVQKYITKTKRFD